MNNEFKNGDNTDFDLIFLYANPLVSDICDIPIKEQIDFEKEINIFNNIFSSLDNSNSMTNPKIIIDIATIDNLYKYLNYKTKIFHLSCHGCYDLIKNFDNEIDTDLLYHNETNIDNHDKDETEYTLYLENLGVVSRLSKSALNKHLNDNFLQLQIDLLFLSACHSEEIKDIFIQKKVKAVISISSLCEISEDSTMAFSEVFYKQIILFNNSIQEGFRIAKIEPLSTFSDEGYDCSCHSHTSICQYNKYIEDNTEYDEEDNNIPNCNCIQLLNNESKYSELNIHKLNCDYANYLINNYHFLYEIDQFSKVQRICCCSINIIHNESSKFLLYCNSSITLYKDNNKPKSNIAKVINNNKSKYDFIPGVIGRKRDLIIAMRNIISPSIRLMIINGEEGIGKYSFAHILFKYCFNRRLFKDGVISISNTCLNESIVIHEIKQFLHLQKTDNDEVVFEALKKKDLMIIIRDNEGIMNSIIQLLLTKTEKLKIIIISNTNRKVLLNSDKEISLSLRSLDDYYSLELFKYLTQNNFSYQIKNETDKELNVKELILLSKGIHLNIYKLVNQLEHKESIKQI